MLTYHMWHTYYITNYIRLVREWLGAGKPQKWQQISCCMGPSATQDMLAQLCTIQVLVVGNKLVVAWALVLTQDMLAQL